MKSAIPALLLSLSSIAAPDALAAPADYDSRLGPGSEVPGHLLTGLNRSDNGVYGDVLALADGRTLIAADSGPQGSTNTIPALLMLLPNGTPDASFASNGRFSQDVIGGLNVPGFGRLAATPDGGYVALATENGAARFDLIKFTASGALDAGFGTDGRVSLSTAAFPASAGGWQSGVVTQPMVVDRQGRILVAANYVRSATSGLTNAWVVCRYLSTGVLDASYGVGDADGVDGCFAQTSGSPQDAISDISGLVLDGDAAIFTGNATLNSQGGVFGAVRLTASGQLDPAFGTGGVVKIGFSGFGAGLGVAIRPDRRLVFAFRPGIGVGSLLQLLPNGSLDPSFGNGDGIVDSSNNQDLAAGTGGNSQAVAADIRDLALQADGKIVLLARTSLGGTPGFTGAQVGRFLANGLQDTGFGDVGPLLRGPRQSQQNGNAPLALTLAADGRIVVIGTQSVFGEPALTYVARLQGGASVPTRVNPFVLVDQFDVPVSTGRESNAVTVAGLDSNVLITGLTVPALVRIDNGSFGVNTDANAGNAIRLVRNGDVVRVRHDSAATPGTRTVTRLTIGVGDDAVSENFISVTAGGSCAVGPGSNTIPGTLDIGFGTNGRRSRAIGADNSFRPTMLLRDDDSVQLAAGANFTRVRPGSPFPSNESDPALFQFTVRGLDDSNFSGDGLADADSLDGRDFTGGYSDAVRQSDGKLVLSARLGIQGGFANVDSAVLRLNADGSRDGSFGSDGGVTLPKPLPNNEVGSLVGVAVQADGRIVGIGSISQTTGQSIGYFLARFNVDGTLDDGSALDSTPGDSFGNNDADGVNGVFLNRSPAAFALSSTGYRVRVQGTRIVVIDTTDAVNEVRLFGHAADGSLDASFGSGGVIRDIRGDGFCIRPELLVQPDQKLLFTAECVIGRLNANGSPDTTFGGDGFVFRDASNTRELTSGLARTATKWLVLQPDGKFLTGGSTSDERTEVARFHADGLPDTGFGDDRISVPLAGSPIFGGLAVDSLGAVLIGNLDNRVGSNTSIELARLCGGASVDTRPDAFSFDDRIDVPLSTEQRSNVYTVSGLEPSVPALIRVENGEYSAGCAGEGEPLFETSMEKVYNGMRICVRHTSAATPGTAVTTTLILSAGPDEFREDFITVTAGGPVQNTAPVAVDDSAETLVNTAALINVLFNDSDADGDALSVVAVSTPANGTVEIVDNQLLYTPAAGFIGTDTFRYTINDGQSPAPPARADRFAAAEADSRQTATVTITVSAAAPANTPPVAVNDTATTPADTAVLVDVLANDRDADGDAFEIASVTNPANGTVEIVDGAIRYTPASGFAGTDSFRYTIATPRRETAAPPRVSAGTTSRQPNAEGDSTQTATVTITVVGAVVPPVVGPDDSVNGSARRGGGAAGGLLGWLALAALLRRVTLRWKMLHGRGLIGAAALLLSAGASATGPAPAGSGNAWYTGVAIGNAASGQRGDGDRAIAGNGNDADATINTLDFSWGVYGGRELNDWLALEASYDNLGRYGAIVSGTSPNPQQLGRDLLNALPIGGDAYGLRLRGSLPLSPTLDAIARLGGYYGHSERQVTINGITERGNDDFGGVMAGLGVRHTLGARWAVVIDTQMYWPEQGKRLVRAALALEFRY